MLHKPAAIITGDGRGTGKAVALQPVWLGFYIVPGHFGFTEDGKICNLERKRK